jgi:hypothetical protein
VIVNAKRVPSGGALEISRKDFRAVDRASVTSLPADGKLAAQAAKLGKPMAEVATGKMAGRSTLCRDGAQPCNRRALRCRGKPAGPSRWSTI